MAPAMRAAFGQDSLRPEPEEDHHQQADGDPLRDADRAMSAMRTHLARVSRHLLGTE